MSSEDDSSQGERAGDLAGASLGFDHASHGSMVLRVGPSSSRRAEPGWPGSGIISTPLTAINPRTSSGPRWYARSSQSSPELWCAVSATCWRETLRSPPFEMSLLKALG